MGDGSPSSRRAWIEISNPMMTHYKVSTVALLAEGVDRNIPKQLLEAVASGVALLAEGVDRNPLRIYDYKERIRSPSSRRAWIEIMP